MDSGGWPLPTEGFIKKGLILEASGLVGSRASFLDSGGWPFPIERLIKKASILKVSGPGRLQGQIPGFWRVAPSY